MKSELLPFIRQLAPSTLVDYPELPKLLPPFEDALDKVVRAESMASQIWRKPNETVLDHLGGEHGILPMVIICFAQCPTLTKELKVRNIITQIFVHDGPEIVVKDYDHAIEKPHRHHLNGKKERAEKIAFHMFLLPLINNPELAEEVCASFNEFMDNTSTEAIFTHLIDRLAGNWAVVSQHLNRVLEKLGRPMGMEASRIDEHISSHAVEVSDLAQKFANAGLSETAQREWWSWFGGVFEEIYTSTGHDNLPSIKELINLHRSLATRI